MAIVEIALPPKVAVSWSCRRCGHTGGVAQTTIPLDPHWTEAMGRVLLDQLRLKLVRVHQKQGCLATPEDFRVGPWRPIGKDIVGQI